MPTIHLIHGIRDDGSKTTECLARVLEREGYSTLPHPLVRTHTWNAWFSRDTKLLARIVMAKMEPGDHIVAHSHGCGIAKQIAKEMRVGKIVMLSPALNMVQRWKGKQFEALLNIHNPADLALWGGSILPGHPFGIGGAVGFWTSDPRVHNERYLSFLGPFNHTHPYFKYPYIEYIADEIETFLDSP